MVFNTSQFSASALWCKSTGCGRPLNRPGLSQMLYLSESVNSTPSTGTLTFATCEYLCYHMIQYRLFSFQAHHAQLKSILPWTFSASTFLTKGWGQDWKGNLQLLQGHRSIYPCGFEALESQETCETCLIFRQHAEAGFPKGKNVKKLWCDLLAACRKHNEPKVPFGLLQAQDLLKSLNKPWETLKNQSEVVPPLLQITCCSEPLQHVEFWTMLG